MARSRKSAYKAATELHAKIVRARGACENPACAHPGEPLQCAHIISRRYANTRTDLENAFCLCRADHMFWTHHPLEWEQFVIEQIGQARYGALVRKALSTGKVDWPAELERLRAIEKELAA